MDCLQGLMPTPDGKEIRTAGKGSFPDTDVGILPGSL